MITDLPVGGGQAVGGGFLVAVMVAIIKGGPSAWKWLKSIWRAQTEVDLRKSQIFEIAQDGVVKWGEKMVADNDALRGRNAELQVEVDELRERLNVALDKIGDLQRANRELGARLQRLEDHGHL